MKNMRILVDTNIIVDYIANREPYVTDAYRIMELCISKKIEGCIAIHTVANLFYILRKKLKKGQEVIVTLLDTKINTVNKNEKFNFSKYTTKTNRKQDPQEYIRELRENESLFSIFEWWIFEMIFRQTRRVFAAIVEL